MCHKKLILTCEFIIFIRIALILNVVEEQNQILIDELSSTNIYLEKS